MSGDKSNACTEFNDSEYQSVYPTWHPKWDQLVALSGDTSFGGAVSILTESVRGPLGDGKTRTRWVLTIPKNATADSPCACTGSPLGTGKADIVIDIPSAFTAAERQDFVDRIQAAVATTVFDASVATPEGS